MNEITESCWTELEEWEGYFPLPEGWDQRDCCEQATSEEILEFLFWRTHGAHEDYCCDLCWADPWWYLPSCGECDACIREWDGKIRKFDDELLYDPSAAPGDTRGTSEFRRIRR